MSSATSVLQVSNTTNVNESDSGLSESAAKKLNKPETGNGEKIKNKNENKIKKVFSLPHLDKTKNESKTDEINDDHKT